jgi:hypothetical protein
MKIPGKKDGIYCGEEGGKVCVLRPSFTIDPNKHSEQKLTFPYGLGYDIKKCEEEFLNLYEERCLENGLRGVHESKLLKTIKLEQERKQIAKDNQIGTGARRI